MSGKDQCPDSAMQHMADGTVVWTKFSGYFWPGLYRNNEDGLFVEFFDEGSCVPLRKMSKIYKYNCDQKLEHIRRGIERYRRFPKRYPFLEKFPKDVRIAEQLTGGDEDILESHFPLREQPSKKCDHVAVPEKKEEPSTSKGLASKRSNLDTSDCSNKDKDVVPLQYLISTKKPKIDSDINDAKVHESTSDEVDHPDEDDDDEYDAKYDLNWLLTPSGPRDINFKVDHIILAPYRGHYLPAFVTRVDSRKHKVTYRFVNSGRTDPVFCRPAKKLLDFRDYKRNEMHRIAAGKKWPLAHQAFEKAVQFYTFRCNKLRDLKPLRFLTNHPDDMTNGIVPTSTGYYREESESDVINEEAEETICNDSDDESVDSNIEILNNTCSAEKPEEIPMEMKQEGIQIVKVIKEDSACSDHLSKILNKDVPSWRDKCFFEREFDSAKMLLDSSGIFPGIEIEMALDILNHLMSNLSKDFKRRKQYLFQVSLPEALLFALRKLRNIDEKEAEAKYKELREYSESGDCDISFE